MAFIVAMVTSADAGGADPDTIQVVLITTWVSSNGSNLNATGVLSIPATASADQINAMTRQKAIEVVAAAPNGITVGPTDVVRVFGGAVPNVS